MGHLHKEKTVYNKVNTASLQSTRIQFNQFDGVKKRSHFIVLGRMELLSSYEIYKENRIKINSFTISGKTIQGRVYDLIKYNRKLGHHFAFDDLIYTFNGDV